MKSILIKLSGELFNKNDNSQDGRFNKAVISCLIDDIKELQNAFQIGIVIGGGNFFRGSSEGKELGLRSASADAIGMLATVMNGAILHELLLQNGISSVHLSARSIPTIAQDITQSSIDAAHQQGAIIIFSGGLGSPCFSTDTTAIVRAVQCGAQQVWKATTVDGIYDKDPRKNPDARFLAHLDYKTVLDNKLGIMDLTAMTMAQSHRISLRVFNLFTPNALQKAALNTTIGSLVE